jgi:hypothetical protein
MQKKLDPSNLSLSPGFPLLARKGRKIDINQSNRCYNLIGLLCLVSMYARCHHSSQYGGEGISDFMGRKGGTHFWTGEKENVVQNDLKVCILSPFGPSEAGKRCKSAQTTHLDLFWAIFSDFLGFSDFCNFGAFFSDSFVTL